MTSSLLKLSSILADLNNAVVWMVSACPIIFKSSSPFSNPLGIVPSTPITISITVTFMFHVFFLGGGLCSVLGGSHYYFYSFESFSHQC